ncbi:MAG: dihydrofolate reductase [Bacteroidetes bacterium]|nr:dihydrofolate reductase [Bacteroidota bacterium]
MKKIIITALSPNYSISENGKIPWNIPSEIMHFKNTTTGHIVLMGRKTYQSLPNPLENRINIVLSKTVIKDEKYPQTMFIDSLEKIKLIIEKYSEKNLFIIGGGEIFAQVLNSIDEMIISFIKQDYNGDIFFPKFDKAEWVQSEIANNSIYSISRFVRK